MKVDKTFLKHYLLNSKNNEYILNLYKVYELCDKVTNHDIYNNRKILDDLEDKIYTIKEKTLSPKERVLYDLKRIIKEFKKSTSNNDTTALLNELIDKIQNSNLNDSESLDLIKQKIVIIESKLNMPINYFYSASDTFLSLYESTLKYNINNKQLDSYQKIYINNKKEDK